MRGQRVAKSPLRQNLSATWSALTTLFSPIFFVSVLGNFGGLADA
jgi:hypothetical protein